jgi:ribosomal RNA-processing protein 8
MGTNFGDFLLEANRVLKPGGILLVAEVLSRITDVKTFLKFLHLTGFAKPKKLEETKMFMSFQLSKKFPKTKAELNQAREKLPEDDVLTPCVYKKR